MGFIAARIAFLGGVLLSALSFAQTRLNGAGATFPEPLYKEWINLYQKSHPDTQIDYEGKGSGAGIAGITEKTVDFAASDAPMSKKELAKAGGNIVQFPAAAGAVVLAYHLPELTAELKLSGPVLADIFQSRISKWNDEKIAALNPGITLPDLNITPVERGTRAGLRLSSPATSARRARILKTTSVTTNKCPGPTAILKGRRTMASRARSRTPTELSDTSN